MLTPGTACWLMTPSPNFDRAGRSARFPEAPRRSFRRRAIGWELLYVPSVTDVAEWRGRC